MNHIRFHISIFSLFLLLSSCSKGLDTPTYDQGADDPPVSPEITEPEWEEGEYGKDFIWDNDYIPEIKIGVGLKTWNSFLENCDKNSNTTSYFKCNVVFERKDIKDSIGVAAIRLRDNADLFNTGSRYRPEGTVGSQHSTESAVWRMSNYELSFNKLSNHLSNTLRGIDGIFLKSCRNDPTYARERFCHELLTQFGIWTTPRNSYCRLSIHIEGDAKPVYLGVYQMIEPINTSYLTDRKSKFILTGGNLWKCNANASLNNITNNLFSSENSQNSALTSYVLLNNVNKFSSAKSQLQDFIYKINTLNDESFCGWIKTIADVELLMKTIASTVVTGTWEDYWNMGQNYYLYFNHGGSGGYKIFLIPYRFDTSLGNTNIKYIYDSGLANPYKWGKSTSTLVSRLLSIPEFKEIYTEALTMLITEEYGLFHPSTSPYLIQGLMSDISFYTSNDTGKMNTARDLTASWSNNDKYTIATTDDSSNNFFKVRVDTIKEAIEAELIP